MLLALAANILAAIDLSLYKYDISHFNSVAGEQGTMAVVIALYFLIMAIMMHRENPFYALRRPILFGQTVSSGAAYVINSFAYTFGPASIIATAFRGFSVLFSILSGNFYFKEKGFIIRTILFCVIVAGLICLI